MRPCSAIAMATLACACASPRGSAPSAPLVSSTEPRGPLGAHEIARAPVALGGPPARARPVAPLSEAALMADVAWLCDPARAGRGSYQDGGRATAAWIAEAFRNAGLEVIRQPIPGGAFNVIGIRRGGPRALVIASHYDHLGVDADGVVYPGADDNASGTAVLLGLVRALAPRRARHTIVFIAFGAEEDALAGSRVYVADPVWPHDRTIALINFDMVGRQLLEMVGTGQPRTAAVVGLEASDRNREVTEAAARAEGLQLFATPVSLVSRLGYDARTDDWWFRRKGIATIHFSTALHRDYHTPSDTPDRLRPGQMARIGRTVLRMAVELAEVSLEP